MKKAWQKEKIRAGPGECVSRKNVKKSSMPTEKENALGTKIVRRKKKKKRK